MKTNKSKIMNIMRFTWTCSWRIACCHMLSFIQTNHCLYCLQSYHYSTARDLQEAATLRLQALRSSHALHFPKGMQVPSVQQRGRMTRKRSPSLSRKTATLKRMAQCLEEQALDDSAGFGSVIAQYLRQMPMLKRAKCGAEIMQLIVSYLDEWRTTFVYSEHRIKKTESILYL